MENNNNKIEVYHFQDESWEEKAFLLKDNKKNYHDLNGFLLGAGEILDINNFIKKELFEKHMGVVPDNLISKKECENLFLQSKFAVPNLPEPSNFIAGFKLQNEWNEKIYFFETAFHFFLYAWETSA